MPLKLNIFGPTWGVPDPSPFCVKLQSFLRLNNIEYTLGDFNMNRLFKEAPKKKIPFIEFEDGERMGDSSLIIARLSRDRNIDMDAALNDEQRAISYSFRRMIDEAMYFNLLYTRWCDDMGWAVLEPKFFGAVPKIVRGLISNHIRKGVKKTAYLQGVGRHSQDDIYAVACKDLDSLSVLLGDHQWFFDSDKPTLLDIWVHASVINIIKPPIETAVKAHCLSLQNLCDHAERFQALAYGDFDQEKKEAA